MPVPIREARPSDDGQPPVTALRLLYTDCAGLRRCRVVPWSGAAAASAPLPAIGLTKGCMGQGAHVDAVLPGSGLSATGEALLTPDPASLVPRLPWHPAHAMANCDLLERGTGGEPWSCCPRSALKRCLARLRSRHGLALRAGFELEFVLLQKGAGAGDWAPVDAATYCSTSALDAQAEGERRKKGRGGERAACLLCLATCTLTITLTLTCNAPRALLPATHAVLDEMVAALRALGVGVVQWHKEAAFGQYEIATAHGEHDALCRAGGGPGGGAAAAMVVRGKRGGTSARQAR